MYWPQKQFGTVDALGDTESVTIGLDEELKVEERTETARIEGSGAVTGNGKTQTNYKAYDKTSTVPSRGYNTGSDAVPAKRKRRDSGSSWRFRNKRRKEEEEEERKKREKKVEEISTDASMSQEEKAKSEKKEKRRRRE